MDRLASHSIMESFLLYIDHHILTEGNAFTNNSSLFYDTDDLINGLYTFGAPFKGLVADESISNADILSGVYLDGSFTERGESNFSGINFEQGQVYFSVENPGEISGDYAIKDIDVFLTNKTEEQLLFESKFHTKPRTREQKNALPPNSLTYPVLFLKKQGQENDLWQFGGTENTKTRIRGIAITDSHYLLEGLETIAMDSIRRTPAIIDKDELPFTYLGDVVGNSYNYDNLVKNKSHDELMWINDVTISRTNNNYFADNFPNSNVYSSFIDWELEHVRTISTRK